VNHLEFKESLPASVRKLHVTFEILKQVRTQLEPVGHVS